MALVSGIRGRTVRDFAVGLSLSNLCFVRAWTWLLDFTRPDLYSAKSAPPPSGYCACIIDVALLGVALAFLVRAARQQNRRGIAARLLFLAVTFFAANSVRLALWKDVPWLQRSFLVTRFGSGVILAFVLMALAAAAAALWWNNRAFRAAAAIALVFSPLVLMTTAQALGRILTVDPRDLADRKLAPALAGKPDRRFIWMLWDEWDQELTFEKRSVGLALPEVDRFRAESIFATNAYAPRGDTLESVPALLTGKTLERVRRIGPADLLLIPSEPARPVHFGSGPTIFSEARAAGFNTAVVGFYHPYCRVLNSALSSCWWESLSWEGNSYGSGLGESSLLLARALFETQFRPVSRESLPHARHGRTCGEALARAIAVATEPGIGLAFLHLPVPHSPYFDPATGRFSAQDEARGYDNNLVLLDGMLGKIRRALEQAGMWDSTTILMSSDHCNRAAVRPERAQAYPVPFLLKLAGQHEPVVFSHRFNTVLTHALVLGVLRGEIADAAGACAWLERRRLAGGSKSVS